MSYKKKLPATNTLSVLAILETMQTPAVPDAVEHRDELKALLLHSERKGLAAYGHTMDRDDLSRSEWMQHLIEELLDGAQYAVKANLGIYAGELLRMALIVARFKKLL